MRRTLLAGLLVVMVAIVYGPAMRGGWLWDDNSEITTNLELRGPWWKIWVAPTGPDYLPLKTTVQWLEWRLWSAESTLGYHLTSIGLHALSALLVWRLFARLGLRLAWFGGLLFAVHPLAVESVAWIAELKNTLSLPPMLLAALSWVRFDQDRRTSDYVATLLWFVVALVCKSSVVVLPVMLGLYLWWRRGRIASRDIKFLAPLFLLSLVFGAVTMWFQSRNTGWIIALGGWETRLARVSAATGFYFQRFVWPAPLLPLYPTPPIAWSASATWLPLLGLGVMAAAAWSKRTAWGRTVLFGLGCTLAALLPVLGFVGMAYFHLSWVGDHLAYVALVPAVGLIVAGVEWTVNRTAMNQAIWGGVILGAGGLALAWQARSYAAVFRDADTLWSYTTQRDPASWLGWNNLGVVRLEQGRWAEALALFSKSTQLRPDFPAAHSNTGEALTKLNRGPEAVQAYEKALLVDPDAVEAHYNLANALAQTGNLAAAIAHYQAAIKLAPASVDAHANLANCLLQTGRVDEAIAHFRAALEVQPHAIEARLGLGNALAAQGNMAAAAQEFERAVTLAPTSVEARYCLADAWVQTGRLAEALPLYQATLQTAPGRTDIRSSYGEALLASGQHDRARIEFETVLKQEPHNAAAQAGWRQAQVRP